MIMHFPSVFCEAITRQECLVKAGLNLRVYYGTIPPGTCNQDEDLDELLCNQLFSEEYPHDLQRDFQPDFALKRVQTRKNFGYKNEESNEGKLLLKKSEVSIAELGRRDSSRIIRNIRSLERHLKLNLFSKEGNFQNDKDKVDLTPDDKLRNFNLLHGKPDSIEKLQKRCSNNSVETRKKKILNTIKPQFQRSPTSLQMFHADRSLDDNLDSPGPVLTADSKSSSQLRSIPLRRVFSARTTLEKAYDFSISKVITKLYSEIDEKKKKNGVKINERKTCNPSIELSTQKKAVDPLQKVGSARHFRSHSPKATKASSQLSCIANSSSKVSPMLAPYSSSKCNVLIQKISSIFTRNGTSKSPQKTNSFSKRVFKKKEKVSVKPLLHRDFNNFENEIDRIISSISEKSSTIAISLQNAC